MNSSEKNQEGEKSGRKDFDVMNLQARVEELSEVLYQGVLTLK